MKKYIESLLGQFDIKVTRKSTFERLFANSEAVQDLEFLKSVSFEVRSKCIEYLDRSKSQLKQDLFALSELRFKEQGFFVEFGATNGIDLSNSYLLETEFGWKGILAEPARMWHKDLQKNRAAEVEKSCVWSSSGETLSFNEAVVGELSTVHRFSGSDQHAKYRKNGKRYDVKTISLTDLLDKYQAPSSIDYLSIDTEGSEYEILKDFNFERYRFNVITCEHNNMPTRQKIYELLTMYGYQRKFEHLSQWDDWYVLR